MKFLLSFVGLILLGALVISFSPQETAGIHQTTDSGMESGRRQPAYEPKSQLSFESNQGQTENRVNYLSRGMNYSLYLTSTEAVFALNREEGKGAAHVKGKKDFSPRPKHTAPAAPVVLKMELVGAKADAAARGEELLGSRSNYFLGSDPRQWRTEVPHYGRVRYSEVYPGIDLVYYGNEGQLEYDFIVAPGQDPNRIKLGFADAAKVSIDGNGDLVLGTSAGDLRQHKPVVYQNIGGERREVAGRYVIEGDRQVKFEIGAYDRSSELVIDPVLIYSTYLGGLDTEFGNSVETDAAGNTYVTGITYSRDFMIKDAVQTSLKGVGNAFVSKFDPQGRLLYSTYLGGSSEDAGIAITCDGAGNAFLVGATDSLNFPTTSGVAQATKGGRLDLFVAKLNSTGNGLVYSSYVGGSDDEVAGGVVIDGSGNAYITGQTLSANFPVRNAVQGTLRGTSDAFLVKLNATGSSTVYSTFLGGTGREAGFGVAVDGSGAAYLTGIVYSNDFPTVNAIQTSIGGRVDLFLSKFNADGNALVYSTYFGGNHDDAGYGIGVDSQGRVAITGFTTSTNFPTKNAFQTANAGGDDAIIAKFDGNGSLLFSSYMGGAAEDRAFDLAVLPSGGVYLTGRTDSENFPVKDPFQTVFNNGAGNTAAAAQLRGEEPLSSPIFDEYGRDSIEFRRQSTAGANSAAGVAQIVRDGFVAKISDTGAINYSSFLGGGDEEKVFGIAVDGNGFASITGLTVSRNFPTRAALQKGLKGTADVFVAKIADQATTQTTASAASFQANALAAEQIVAAFGYDFVPGIVSAKSVPLPTTLDGLTIKVIDSAGAERAASLFYVSAGQINYYIPAGTALGTARVVVTRNNVVISTETVRIETVAPGIFSATSNGLGLASAVVLRVKADGTQVYEPMVRYDSSLNKFVAVPITFGDATDRVYLVLYGTGIRNRSSLAAVSTSVGGTAVAPLFAGAQGQCVGLDQINLELPRSLAGRGEVDIQVSVDGKIANSVKVNIQ
jgi:uncharacterized protein (TIGR03437 family)